MGCCGPCGQHRLSPPICLQDDKAMAAYVCLTAASDAGCSDPIRAPQLIVNYSWTPIR